MTIAGNFPYKLDNTVLPFPDNPPEEKYDNIENVKVSETGKDIVQVTRKGKLTLGFTYQLPASWIKTFEDYALSNDLITVSLPNATATAYQTKTMRMENYSKKIVKGSERLTDVAGVWQFKFDLIEM